MKITIFGMGYVGVVSAACLLRDGHDVCGVDPVRSKVDDLNQGRTPIQEPGVRELLAAGHASGRLHAYTEPGPAMDGADMVWICVGTPSGPDGRIHLAAVETAAREIGEYLGKANDRPLVVLRSTALPGTTRGMVVPAIEQHSGLTVGADIHVVFHPEFLREGSAVDDFNHPPKIVMGEAHHGGGQCLLSLYEQYEAPRFVLELEEAELVKYYDNLFHAVKITFANELASIARTAAIDARRVAEVFCADTKLNISARYLRPGFAFGGSCLPKDLRAIVRYAAGQSVRIPMLEAMLASNSMQIEKLVSRVLERRPHTVGMVGLAFKSDTDDMRESPYVAVAKRLIGEGVALRIHDPSVDPGRLVGGNRQAVQAALAHLEALLVPTTDAFCDCDMILVNHAIVDKNRIDGWLDKGIRVLDLAGIPGVDRHRKGYEGIFW